MPRLKWSCFNKARLDWNKVTRHKTIINDNPLMAKLIYLGFQDNTACINNWPGQIKPIPGQLSGINGPAKTI